MTEAEVKDQEKRVAVAAKIAAGTGVALRELSAELVRQSMPDTLIDAMDRAAKELEQASEALMPPEEGQGD